MIKLGKLIEAINDAAEIANAELADSKDQVINDFFHYDEETDKYTAKKVTIEYPSVNKEGKVETVNIDVPLLTVVPISSAKIDELRFTTVLDVAIENEYVMVSFNSKNPGGDKEDKSPKHSTAKLELIIKPQENTDGLNKLIEGYEKLLRSQIPG